MDRVTDLAEIVQREVGDYAGPAYKAKTYYVEDEKHRMYTVITVPDHDYPINLKAGITVMARIVGDKVVIEQDITDRPLYEALEVAGVPREQIILAYAGETLPDEKEETT
jgi:hypothetical protein